MDAEPRRDPEPASPSGSGPRARPRRPQPPGSAQPAALRRAAVLVAVEGTALAVLGVGYAISGVVGSPEDRTATVLAGLFAAVAGAGLVAAGRGLALVRPWALAPTVLAQVLLLVVAVGLLQGGVLGVGLPLALAAVAVLALLASRASRDVFRGAA